MVLNVLIVLTVTFFCVEAVIAKSSLPIIKLIHPLSIHSPFYNPNSNNSDIIIDASEARFKFIDAEARNLTVTDAYELPIHPLSVGRSFVALTSIGTPGVPQFLIMDTGSSFTWTQCVGCTPCMTHTGIDYDHRLSQSDLGIPCGSPECNSAPQNTCVGPYCRYSIHYADTSTSTGIVMSETFNFKDGSTAPDIVFGCGYANKAAFKEDSSGVLGLGPEEISILHRLGSKFSYCLGYRNEQEHFLMMGNGAIMLGNPSPLIVRSHYYVSLQGIMVGDMHLNIDPELFRLQPDGTGGVVIDSGSILSYLLPPAYEALKAEMARRVRGMVRTIYEGSPSMLCYKGLVQDLKNIPLVTLNFEGGQTLQLNQYSSFYQKTPRMLCMTFNGSPRGLMNLIGYSAQQNYNVGYDILGETIHFHRAPCRDLAN